MGEGVGRNTSRVLESHPAACDQSGDSCSRYQGRSRFICRLDLRVDVLAEPWIALLSGQVHEVIQLDVPQRLLGVSHGVENAARLNPPNNPRKSLMLFRFFQIVSSAAAAQLL